MKKSTKIALGFFLLAILLESITLNIHTKDIRLFVGVFIVLGLAFLTYSIKEDSNLSGYLLFEGKTITQDHLVKLNQNEYYLKANTEYLWIDNSIFLKWQDHGRFEDFITGFATAISGSKRPLKDDYYLTFKLDQNSYTSEKSLEELLSSSHFKVIEKGSTLTFCSKDIFLGKRIFRIISALLVISLILYMVLQII